MHGGHRNETAERPKTLSRSSFGAKVNTQANSEQHRRFPTRPVLVAFLGPACVARLHLDVLSRLVVAAVTAPREVTFSAESLCLLLISKRDSSVDLPGFFSGASKMLAWTLHPRFSAGARQFLRPTLHSFLQRPISVGWQVQPRAARGKPQQTAPFLELRRMPLGHLCPEPGAVARPQTVHSAFLVSCSFGCPFITLIDRIFYQDAVIAVISCRFISYSISIVENEIHNCRSATRSLSAADYVSCFCSLLLTKK